MSFQVNLKKNEQGTYDVTTTSPDTLPDAIQISGHVELTSDGEVVVGARVVDLNVRCQGIYASASRRENQLYMF